MLLFSSLNIYFGMFYIHVKEHNYLREKFKWIFHIWHNCHSFINVHKYTVWGDNHGHSVFQSLSVSESLIPEEYHIVKNKGLQSLEFYEEWVSSTLFMLPVHPHVIVVKLEFSFPVNSHVAPLPQCVHSAAAGWWAEATGLPFTVSSKICVNLIYR